MHRLYWIGATALAAATFGSCKTPSPPTPRTEVASHPGPAPAAESAAPTTSGSAAPVEPDPVALAAVSGRLPFDYPETPTSARPGDYVLVPPRAFLDEALERGLHTQPFVFYGAFMQTPGTAGSYVRTLPGSIEAIPNPLLIPIRSGERVQPGSVVLTTWAWGTGMQRAIVVGGGAPDSPRVRYLDLALDHPSGRGDQEDTLPPNTFHRLTQPGEVGSSVACRDAKRRLHLVVIHRTGEQLLGLGFAGKLQVFGQADCEALPLLPAVKPRDTVHIPVLGELTEAEVVEVDALIGRVIAKYQFGKDQRRAAVGFGNVAVDGTRSDSPQGRK